MPPSGSMLPSVPPKDKNLILNLPIVLNRPPSIDMEIASVERPPPKSPNHYRYHISSWKPSPPDRSQSQPPESEKNLGGLLEIFEEIPITELARLPKPEISSKFSLNDYISKMSLGSRPQWVKKLRPIKRGVDLPFPIASREND
ncbi:hypothetical protein Clacol_002336 [Clathrus columnatus]|uniref:Uncharacterized protein n=1 Tax=Clathrus columnatus TaxID=1419009 RepID=A0AAV5A649_9AGAM|nr:hypothetical protein Clacol_002336 [Clathrus columnatus]